MLKYIATQFATTGCNPAADELEIVCADGKVVLNKFLTIKSIPYIKQQVQSMSECKRIHIENITKNPYKQYLNAVWNQNLCQTPKTSSMPISS